MTELRKITIEALVDDNNSSSIPLGISGVFTGIATEILDYGIIFINVYSDVASATDGLSIQQSSDGTNWDHSDVFTIQAATGKNFSINPHSKYLRVAYTNGGTEQTEFRLQTILKGNSKPSSHRLQDMITDDDDVELVKAVLAGKAGGTNYVNFTATNAGNFKVSLEEVENTISDDSNSSIKVSNYGTDEFSNSARLLVDNIFRGALLTTPIEHHEIHCGDSYTAHHVADLTNGASIDYLIVVPNWGTVDGTNPGDDQSIKLAHLIGEVSGEAETSFYIYEGPTVTVNGTAVTSVNRNRNSSKTDFLTIYQGATVSATGTRLEYGKLGSGKVLGGAVNRTDEWVLKNNTTYLLRVTNDTTSNNYHTIRFQYYIHPGV